MNINDASLEKSTSAGYKQSILLPVVCAYMFLVIERPWESISYLNGVPIERVFALITICIAILVFKFKIVASPTNKWVYSLLGLHFILAPFAFNAADAFGQGVEYAKMIVLYCLMLSIADDIVPFKLILKTYVFSMLIYVLHSLWEYHNGRHFFRMGIHRMIGVDSYANDPNSFAASVVLCIPFVYLFFKSENRRPAKLLYFAYFPLAVTCVVLTGSRSGAIALITLLFLFAVLQTGGKRILALSCFFLFLSIVWTNMPEEKQDRIRTLWDKGAGPASAYESADGRILGLQAGWRMFKERPLTGVGAGGKNFIGYRVTNNIDGEGRKFPVEAHNLYGEVLGELGLLGAVAFVGLLCSIVKCVWTTRKFAGSTLFLNDCAAAIMASLFLLLVLGISGHNFYRPLWLWLAAWAGCCYRIVQSQQKSVLRDN